MREIVISAVNEQGHKALQEHIDSYKKIGFINQMTMKMMGYSQEVLNQQPLSLSFKVNNKRMEAEHHFKAILEEIKTALELNGANCEHDLTFDFYGGIL